MNFLLYPGVIPLPTPGQTFHARHPLEMESLPWDWDMENCRWWCHYYLSFVSVTLGWSLALKTYLLLVTVHYVLKMQVSPPDLFQSYPDRKNVLCRQHISIRFRYWQKPKHTDWEGPKNWHASERENTEYYRWAYCRMKMVAEIGDWYMCVRIHHPLGNPRIVTLSSAKLLWENKSQASVAGHTAAFGMLAAAPCSTCLICHCSSRARCSSTMSMTITSILCIWLSFFMGPF